MVPFLLQLSHPTEAKTTLCDHLGMFECKQSRSKGKSYIYVHVDGEFTRHELKESADIMDGGWFSLALVELVYHYLTTWEEYEDLMYKHWKKNMGLMPGIKWVDEVVEVRVENGQKITTGSSAHFEINPDQIDPEQIQLWFKPLKGVFRVGG